MICRRSGKTLNLHERPYRPEFVSLFRMRSKLILRFSNNSHYPILGIRRGTMEVPKENRQTDKSHDVVLTIFSYQNHGFV